MGLFDQSQGLMGLGQPQQVQSPMGGLVNRPPSLTQIADQQRANAMTSQFNAMTPQQQINFMGQPQGNTSQFEIGVPSPFMNQFGGGQPLTPAQEGMQRENSIRQWENTPSDQRPIWQQPSEATEYPQGNMPQIGRPLGRFNPANTLLDGTRNSEGGSYEYPQQFQFSSMPAGFNGIPQESNYMGENRMYINPNGPTPALRPTPQPPQIFQTPMQQQPNNPVNTQTVQPNFMGQTPFGQPQTGQFTSTNPFVQAAQANAQGNIAGALQATAANRINQQTPYGSLSYQQTGTDAQGNPIWSANQQLSPELQQLTQSSLANLQASQANPMYGINPGDTYSNAIMQRLAPQQSQAREALDAQLANQGIMPGSEAYNRAKTLLGQTQNDALTSAIVGGMQTGLQAQDLQNKSAANIRNLATPGYVTPYNQAAVAGPDYLSAYTSQNATEIARQNAEAAQRSAMLGGLAGLGSSAILGGTGPNSALGGLYGLGSKGLEALGNTSLWNSLFGGGGSAITGDKDFLKSIGLDNTFYGSGIEGMLTDPLAGYDFL